ncbi:MAG: dimethyl sulfoxide reductase anchor subunit [Nitrospirae bacterium]|nr:dimethyl sulfoxide reductase anchor subunit [Candidatus Troglogloeales bacterium]
MAEMESQYHTPIDLGQTYPDLKDKPLSINGQEILSHNPNRYKQHGFHFVADNCIGCHACETACAEKNGTPAHLSYRKVGYVEGGTYPNFARVNISMACNHCEDPVCLKGCPTLAYTKYVEYGAVLQDPNICFGCGYCTWVCPYNAPILDPVKGEVQKCNMCVDRLEDGLKPACVSACLSNALDFGVIESIPNVAQQAKLDIPGFPDPAITRPNIRFEQKRSLPAQMTRADNDPFFYEKVGTPTADKFNNGRYKIKPIEPTKQSGGQPRMGWGLSYLRSREDSLVQFTLLYQMVLGGFLSLFFSLLSPNTNPIGNLIATHPTTLKGTLFVLIGLLFYGMFSSTMHLGKPQFFYRAINNLRHSWVSREIFTTGTFFGLLAGYAGIMAIPSTLLWLSPPFIILPALICLWGAAMVGPIGLYCMVCCYRIPARPFWNHWHTGGVFTASALILGPLLIGFISGLTALYTDEKTVSIFSFLAWPLLMGVLLQEVSLLAHIRYLNRKGEEAAVSRMIMLNRFGKTYIARHISLVVLMIGAILFAFQSQALSRLIIGWWPGLGVFLWGILFVQAIFHELIGRVLFYVAVVPTTIPGAFFWGNKAFEEHARKSGLAQMPQVGVVPVKH